ncbi:MAG TPA: SDR family NAD(P)-dependent oxidoreductase, partial [Casimicrobiaceae bacterium]|nr:SDR family NAD(P)-dependent oxidoreductase [Casimicrobiaceae bacterium]
LVTGAARGIGRAVSERLGREGALVMLLDKLDGVLTTAKELRAAGLRAEPIVGDVTDESAVRSAVAGIAARSGRLDILVNNAGISPKHNGHKPLTPDISFAEWQLVFAVNLTSAFLFAREAIPIMRANNWGRIVNIASYVGQTGARFAGAHYSASKAGLIGLSRTLAHEVGESGITVNCVAPGRIATAMNAWANASGANEEFIAAIPIKRIGTGDDIASAVSFLASDEASYMTGATLDVNGGYFMR